MARGRDALAGANGDIAAALRANNVQSAPGRLRGEITVTNIAAQTDLRNLDEVGAAFTRDTGKVVTLTYGSSGNFLRQIQQGAPFQMFLSADEGFVRRLFA